MSEIFHATGLFTPNETLSNQNAPKLKELLSNVTIKKSVKHDNNLARKAQRNLSLDELIDQMEISTQQENRSAVKYLKQMLTSLEGCKTIKCTFDQMLFKARVELEADKRHTESLYFRATNALHLSGSELQTAKSLSFEANIINDGILLTGLTGLSVKVNVLKGTSRCDVLEARIKATPEKCMLKLKIKSPLTGETSENFALVELESDLSNDLSDETPEAKERRLSEKRKQAQDLRTTYTGMKSLSLSDLVSHTVSTVAKKEDVAPVPMHVRNEYQEKILMILAISLIMIACYVYLMTRAPYVVPIVMTLSSISLFLLAFERKWHLKSKIAIWSAQLRC